MLQQSLQDPKDAVAVAVAVPRLVLRLPSSRRAWCSGCCRRATLVLQLPSLCCAWCHGCCHRATVVSQSQLPLLRHMWCHRHRHWATWVSPLPFLRHIWYCRRCRPCCAMCSVAVAIATFVPHVVLGLRSLCCMWCRGHGRHLCAACGVVPAVVCTVCGSQLWSLHHVGVVVTIFAPHVVSRLQSLHRMQVAIAVIVLHVVLQLQSLSCVWVALTVFAPRVSHSRGLCTACESRSRSSRHVWCRSRCHCAA